MYNENMSEEQIVNEIKDLICSIEGVQENIDSYCQFLKDMFLSCSGRN